MSRDALDGLLESEMEKEHEFKDMMNSETEYLSPTIRLPKDHFNTTAQRPDVCLREVATSPASMSGARFDTPSHTR